MASLILQKDVERNTLQFASSDITKTVTLATPLLDVSKSVLLFSIAGDTSSPVNFNVLGRILSTTQIQFERALTPAATCDVSWQVLEFSQGINVQHFYFQQATDTVNTTIVSVDTNKTFVILTQKVTGSALSTDDMFHADITSATNLATRGGTTGATCYIAAQVVTIDDATVQKTTTLFQSSATDVTVSSITEDKTFWFFGLSGVAGNTYGMQALPYLQYVNPTTLRYKRDANPGSAFSIVAYVVSLSSGVKVQNVLTTITGGSAVTSASIPSSVTVANTALNINSVYQKFATVPTTSDEAGWGAFILSGLTPNQFVARRAVAAALSAETHIQVLEFSRQTSLRPTRIFDSCFERFFEPCMN